MLRCSTPCLNVSLGAQCRDAGDHENATGCCSPRVIDMWANRSMPVISNVVPVDKDLLVFLVVCALRVFVPLLIFRFPLPAILASLVIDAGDQTVFQTITNIELDDSTADNYLNYQPYDKALDIFYLTIAYISVFRNWRNPTAILVAAFLWYWRLFGATLFELTGWRPLLLIFPNTFEYFFIFICLVKLAWDSSKLTKKRVWTAAIAIWVLIKLPQEYWLHIAQLDVTEVLKETILGVHATDSFGAGFANRPVVTALLLAVLVGLGYLLVRTWRKMPAPDHALTMDSNKVPPFKVPGDPGARRWTDGLPEKIALLAMISIIFVEAVPGSAATPGETIFAVVVIVAGNALVGQWMGRRGHSWETVGGAFVGTLAVNTAILLLLTVGSDDEFQLGAAAFFLSLLSLVVSLFDRYRPNREDITGEMAAANVPSLA